MNLVRADSRPLRVLAESSVFKLAEVSGNNELATSVVSSTGQAEFHFSEV